jgi:5-methylcytosine-specific restriction protein B
MKIIDQLRDCLSDVGLGTRMKRQEIVSLVVDRFGTNPNSIVPSDYCYNMTNKGIASDHVSFFLNVGTGVYEYVGEDYSTPTIQQIIAEYKADFERVDDEERYKWEALGHYKQHWNIEADNFAEMCREAYRWAGEQYKRPRDGKTDGGNLLTSQMYYPYKMIVEFAENDPEFVRHLFKSLFDEEVPLERRYLDFRAGCEKCLEEKRKREPDRGDKGLNHYQDLHAISVYLAFEFPEKYFIYKYSVYTKFRDLIAFQDGKGTSEVWKLENYNRMCNYVLAAVRSDDELTELSRRRLDENCYKDPEYHLLTMDVVYFGSRIDKGRVYKMNGSSKGHPGQGTDIGKNTILYGPPGTGKTYHTVLYAVSIIENKPLAEIKSEPYETVLDRFNQYKADKLIEFTTFHQSYGYEEFIEGIKPNTETDGEESGDIEYSIEAGLFKEFCERASQPIAKKAMDDVGLNSTPTVWKVSLYGTGDNPDRAECLQNGHIRIGWDGYGQTLADDLAYKDGGKAILNAFMNKMKIGDIVLSCYSSTTIDAIGIVAGDYEWHDEYAEMKRLRKVKWLAKDIREDIVELNNGRALVQPTVYQLNISAADAMNLAMKYMPKTKQLQSPRDNFVFIIDEINRGNNNLQFHAPYPD